LQKEYKPKKRQNKLKAIYYGNADELDAHAYETRAERIDINKLRKAHKIGWRECEAVFMYRMHFRKQDPKIWKRFLKKVYKANAKIHYTAFIQAVKRLESAGKFKSNPEMIRQIEVYIETLK
jgi:hypothetical protein